MHAAGAQALTVARSGSKLTPAKEGEGLRMGNFPDQITAIAVPINVLANALAANLGRFVRDETGLTDNTTSN
jgi:Protein of unknown function (DUF3738)